MLVCPDTDERTRVGFRFTDDGRKVRYSKKSGNIHRVAERGEKMENRMYTRYLEEVVPTLTAEFGYTRIRCKCRRLARSR